MDWDEMLPGQTILIGGEGERNIKIEFNTSMPTVFHICWETSNDVGEVKSHKVFLGVIHGWDKIEVAAGPSHWIEATSDGEVWYFTNDGQYTAVDHFGEHSFTKLIGEQSRADAMEQIIRQQTARIEQLRAQQAWERDNAAILAERLGAAEAAIVAEREAQAELSEQPAGEGEDGTDGGTDAAVSA